MSQETNSQFWERVAKTDPPIGYHKLAASLASSATWEGGEGLEMASRTFYEHFTRVPWSETTSDTKNQVRSAMRAALSTRPDGESAGVAKGLLEGSEAAGAVRGWRERAEAAERERDGARAVIGAATAQLAAEREGNPNLDGCFRRVTAILTDAASARRTEGV